jgi:integrase/recombinase XerD
MLDKLDLLLRWYLDDVRGRFVDGPVLLCDESGGRMAAATIRNRLRHLMIVEGRPESEWFSPHGMRRACATHNYVRGVDPSATVSRRPKPTDGNRRKHR